MERNYISIHYTLREKNRVADKLAKMGTEQECQLVALVIAPKQIRDLLAAYIAGVSLRMVSPLFRLC